MDMMAPDLVDTVESAHTIGRTSGRSLMTPGIDLACADPVFARNLGRRQVRAKALADNRQLLLGRPRPPTLRTGENFDTGSVCPESLLRRPSSGDLLRSDAHGHTAAALRCSHITRLTAELS